MLLMIFIIVLPVLIFDQLTKIVVIKSLSLYQSIPVIKGIFHITLVHNRGAAFGILKNQVPLFIITSLFAIGLIYYNLKGDKHKKPSLMSVSLSFILAGAIGNLIDRIIFGHVIDFLDFRIWPVFNIADSAITVGAVLIGYAILFKKTAASK
ncbi:MAG: signal peptidase II [Candidatus Omnitrophota bacterium]|jgi:signal peptidase II